MTAWKKLIFTLPFLISLAWFSLQIEPLLKNPNFLFSLELSIFIQILLLLLSLILTSFFFILFATLANSWKIVLPVALISSLSSILLISLAQNYLLAAGFFLSFALAFLFLNRSLKTYINFSPSVLLTPVTRNLITLLLLTLSVAFYLSSTSQIKEKGFTLPDSMIDSTLKLMPVPQTTQTPQVSKEQTELLKQNPQVLEQFGLNAKSLEMLESRGLVKGVVVKDSENKNQNPLNSMVESQLQTMIKPYLDFMPPLLALIFFFTLKALVSLISIPLPGFIWFIFWILEKTGFLTFTTETREVKKLKI